jgi:XRE family transcriptional regulator, regulator of sulfur utilization
MLDLILCSIYYTFYIKYIKHTKSVSTQLLPNVGKQVINLRGRVKMSVTELSKRSGLSKGMISQIEQNKTNPTLLSLWKISNALSIPLSNIIDPGINKIFDFQQFEEKLLMVSKDKKCHLRFLTPVHYIDKLELYSLKLLKGGKLENTTGHPPKTEEIFNVVSGRFLVTAGDRQQELTTGDSIHFSADIEHTIRNISEKSSEGILVVRFNL